MPNPTWWSFAAWRRPALAAGCGLVLALVGCGARSEGEPGTGGVAGHAGASAPPPSRPPSLPLAPGETRQETLTGGRTVAHRVELPAGEYAQLIVEQQGIDVVATVVAPDGRPLLAIDSPNGTQGPEHLFLVAAAGGEHALEVRAYNEGGIGRYSVTLAARRPATRDDRLRAAGARALGEGDAALAHDDPVARREAVHHYERAFALFSGVGERYPAMVARMKLGRAWSREGETRQAVMHWQAALGAARALGVEADVSSLGNELGLAYRRLGEGEAARASFERSLAGARARRDLREEMVSLNNLALLEDAAGEPWRALLLFEQALVGWRTLGDTQGEGTTLQNLGDLFIGLGRLPEARDLLERALRLFRAGGNRRREATAAMALGWIRCLEGDFVGGRRDLLRSLALRREVGDRSGEAVTLDRLGKASREGGRPARAVREFEQALAILRALEDRRSEAYTLSNLGDALVAAGNPEAGLARLNAAIALLPPGDDPSAAAYAYFRRAKAKRALGDLDSARADLEVALPRLESVRTRAEVTALRTSFLASAHEQYELAIDLLMELHARHPHAGHDRAALDVAERARARGLLDLLHEARSHGDAAAALGRGDRLRRVEDEIRALGGAAVGSARLRQLLLDRERALVELRRPSTAAGEPSILDSGAMQRQLLDSETLLVVYALGEERSFLWAVTATEIVSAVLPPRADVADAVRRLLAVFAAAWGPESAIQERLVGAEVARLLLGPIASRLGAKRLVIVADGALARVPFAALPDPRGSGAPLVERHEIVAIPSASALAAVRRRAGERVRAPGLVAVVADPVFSRQDPRLSRPGRRTGRPSLAPALSITAGTVAVTRAARDLGLRDFARVPFTRQEAAAIAAQAAPRRMLQMNGLAATRGMVLGGRLAQYRIVHFATHALLHPEHPELSGIVLSLYDRAGRAQDGFLRSYEIAALDLPVDLVVLSACRTGAGREVRGEGLVGLTQSFFEAGAARVLASLWDVADEPTARLMERFYRELLGNGRPPAAALREAQRSLRADPRWAAPYYWAGFVLAGDWREPPREQAAGVSPPRTLPRLAPGGSREEGTMDSEKLARATREGGTPGDTGGTTKGDKVVEPAPGPVTPAGESGGEPGEGNDPKPTSKRI